MIRIAGDTHTHTVVCDHAFSTIMENIARAKAIGHTFQCITEHGPAMPGGAGKLHFGMLARNVHQNIDGVEIIRGAEANIIDYDGNLDLPDSLISQLEWVIASYHPPVIAPGTRADHTRGWVKIAENPRIHVIGHCGRSHYGFEHLPVLRAFKESGKIVEVNASSLRHDDSYDNCRKIALLCAEMSIPVVLSSDAHICCDIGNIDEAGRMLEEIGFPLGLILNTEHDKFMNAIKRIDKMHWGNYAKT